MYILRFQRGNKMDVQATFKSYIINNRPDLLNKSGELNHNAIARETDIPQPTITRFLNEEIANPKISFLKKLSDGLRIPLTKILEGSSTQTSIQANSNIALRNIPILSYTESLKYTEVLSAHLNNKKNESAREYIVVPEDAALSDQCFGVILNDNSMTPKFEKDDEITIDPLAELIPGCFVWVIHPKRKQPYLRKYVETTHGCELVPLNNDYGIDEYDNPEDIVIGRAVRKTSKL